MGEPGGMGGVNRGLAIRLERQMAVSAGRRPPPDDEPHDRCVDPVRECVLGVDHSAGPEGEQHGVVEPTRPPQVGHLEADVVDHVG
ncbi:MAG: hypothetical protein ACRDL5_02940, partial [Solirubrobacteraceae bacterium]